MRASSGGPTRTPWAPSPRNIFSISGMWKDVSLGNVREKSALWSGSEEADGGGGGPRNRRARTLDRPHKVNPNAWTNFRASRVHCSAV